MARPLWGVRLDGGPQRVNHSAVLMGSKIFMFGGYCSKFDNDASRSLEADKAIDVYVFDTVHLQWNKPFIQDRRNAPYMRYGHATVSIGNLVYLFGGTSEEQSPCNKLFIFNIRNLSWSQQHTTGRIPEARDGHGMCVVNSCIWVSGGYVPVIRSYPDELFKLDISTMEWSILLTEGRVNLWREFHSLTACNGKIYLFGGISELEHEMEAVDYYDNDIKVLDPETLIWSSCARPGQKLPAGRRSHTTFVHEDCLYIFGGYNCSFNQHFNDLWKFDPVSGSWSELSTTGVKPCQRRRHCCCYFNGSAYIFGGTTPITANSVNFNDLRDLSDMHILDLEPTLKSLCLFHILKYRDLLDISCLPRTLRVTLQRMSTNSNITAMADMTEKS